MALSRVSAPSKRSYQNADGPGGSTNNYGPRRTPDEATQRQNLMDQYGSSGFYGRQNSRSPMPAVDPNGLPRYTPDSGDPRNAGYYVPEPSAAAQAQWQGGQDAMNSARQQAYGADPAIAAARGAGDMRGYIQAMTALKQRGQQDRFVAQGGTPETWAGRYSPDANWPVPGVPGGGQVSHGPGRPDFPGGMTPQPAPSGRMGGAGGIQGYQPTAAPMQGGRQPVAGNLRMEPGQQFYTQNGGYGQGWLPPGGNPGMSTGQGALGLNSAMMEPGRTFPGGVTPTNPGSYGGRPVNPGYPTTPNPYPNPYMGGGYPPGQGGGGGGFMPGQYGGALPNDLMGGMQMFGYRPMGGGYQSQMQGNPFAAMGGGFY